MFPCCSLIFIKIIKFDTLQFFLKLLLQYLFVRRVRSIPQSQSESQLEVHTHAHTHERRQGRGNVEKEKGKEEEKVDEGDLSENKINIPPLSLLQPDQDENIGMARTQLLYPYLYWYLFHNKLHFM